MIDTAKLHVKAGNGGDGVVSFINVFYNPRGGPDGGNGGKGGNVYLQASNKVTTLFDFKTKRTLIAKSGTSGSKNYKYGKNGEDLVINVPVGTIVERLNNDKYEVIADLLSLGDTVLVAKGGLGGFGNAHFKSSTNINPKESTEGKSGVEAILRLELKLLSNVGLIGFPSVGKSTILNSLANTNAKTASYHFTTLSPNLGVLKLSKDKQLIVADLPGLIEGASKGKGLGEDFLRHAERCGILIHVLDPTQTSEFLTNYSDINTDKVAKELISNYDTIRNEITTWSKTLSKKPEIVVVNKCDITEVKAISDTLIKEVSKKLDKKVILLSAVSKEGIDTLVKELLANYDRIIKESEKQLYNKKSDTFKHITIENMPNKRILS